MNDCIFCKILKGELPCMKIYEDEHTLSFLDIAKDVDGHILVIPKKHVTNILDADGETLSHVMNTVKKIGAHLTENCGYEGMNILNANNECSGQTVFHLHIHIIPRKRGDNVAGFPKFAGAATPLEEMYERLRMDKIKA